MQENFLCTSSFDNSVNKAFITIGKRNKNSEHSFYHDVRHLPVLTKEHADQLAVFVTLGKIEKLGIKQAKIFHFCPFLKTRNSDMLKKNPQIVFINERLKRMRKKGFDIIFSYFTKKAHKHMAEIKKNAEAFSKKNQMHAIATFSISQSNENVKVLQKNMPGKTVNSPLNNISNQGEKIKKLFPLFKDNEKIALTDQDNYVIDFIEKGKAKKLVSKKQAIKINENNYQLIKSTYTAHKELVWLNVKQLEVPSILVSLDSLLPYDKRKYTKVLTRNGKFLFVLSKKVAEQLVKEKGANFVTPSKRTIVLLFDKTELYHSVHKKCNRTCKYCEKKETGKKQITLEHVLPKSKGGLTTPLNCISACDKCNNEKGNLNIKEYYHFLTNENAS